MRFLLDQDVFAVTLHFLIELGHDVIPVVQLGLSRANDEGLLKVAQEQNEFSSHVTAILGTLSLSRHWERASSIFVCCLRRKNLCMLNSKRY
jgi:hypothetical protein